MKGLYRYYDRDDITNHGEIIVKVTETEKSYIWELVKNDMRFSPSHIEMMFRESSKARINKERSPHALKTWADGDFTIYPYRLGVPFWFEKTEIV